MLLPEQASDIESTLYKNIPQCVDHKRGGWLFTFVSMIDIKVINVLRADGF